MSNSVKRQFKIHRAGIGVFSTKPLVNEEIGYVSRGTYKGRVSFPAPCLLKATLTPSEDGSECLQV